MRRRLHEAEAHAAILGEQLKLTRQWLSDANDRVAELKDRVAQTEAESQDRLALLRAEHERHRQQVQALAERLTMTELDSQQRLALLRAARARLTAQAQEAAERLAQTENDSQQRLALLRAAEARVRAQDQGAPPTVLRASDAQEDAADAPADDAARENAASQGRAPVVSAPPPVSNVLTVIRPAEARRGIDFAELWQYRYLFAALVRRNVRVEFDSTRLGSLWSVARPLLLAFVFVTFRNFSNAETREGLPYAVWVYTGLLFWTYFTDATTNAAVAVRNDAPLLTKVYYPRLLTPMVPILSGLVTLGLGVVPILGLMVWFGMTPGWMLVLLPLVILQCIATALGLGLIVSSISIENRDWERLFIFGLTVGMWISPVIYAPEMIPLDLRWLYYLNPMVGLMLAFRATMFGELPAPLWEWMYSGAFSLLVLVIGIWAFRRTEIRLLDRL